MPSDSNQPLTLNQLPVSHRTLTAGPGFMMSDNLDQSDALRVLDLDNATRVALRRPFRLTFGITLLCAGGTMQVRLGMETLTLEAGDLLVMPEGSIGECLSISPDARLLMLACASGFMGAGLGETAVTGSLAGMMRQPVLHLDAGEADCVTSLYHMLWSRLRDPSYPSGPELARCCMRTIHCYLRGHMQTASSAYSSALTRGRMLTDTFLDLVETHFRTRRDLAFYAGLMNITPKYLSKTVMVNSGQSARSWICLRVILEAKVLLRDRRLTVQQVGDRLNFANQSFFGTYFKRATGMSPGEYRNEV